MIPVWCPHLWAITWSTRCFLWSFVLYFQICDSYLMGGDRQIDWNIVFVVLGTKSLNSFSPLLRMFKPLSLQIGGRHTTIIPALAGHPSCRRRLQHPMERRHRQKSSVQPGSEQPLVCLSVLVPLLVLYSGRNSGGSHISPEISTPSGLVFVEFHQKLYFAHFFEHISAARFQLGGRMSGRIIIYFKNGIHFESSFPFQHTSRDFKWRWFCKNEGEGRDR